MVTLNFLALKSYIEMHSNFIKIENVKSHVNRIYVVFKLNKVNMCKNENRMQAISSKYDIFVYEKPISVIYLMEVIWNE